MAGNFWQGSFGKEIQEEEGRRKEAVRRLSKSIRHAVANPQGIGRRIDFLSGNDRRPPTVFGKEVEARRLRCAFRQAPKNVLACLVVFKRGEHFLGAVNRKYTFLRVILLVQDGLGDASRTNN